MDTTLQWHSLAVRKSGPLGRPSGSGMEEEEEKFSALDKKWVIPLTLMLIWSGSP